MMLISSRRHLLLLGGAAAVAAAAGVGVALTTRRAEAVVPTGNAAPAFSVQDAEGRARSLSEFAGRTVILEWTNKDCPYVRKHYASGDMQGLQRDATAQGAVWLSVISSAPGTQGYLQGPQAVAHAREVNAHATAILLDPTGVMGRAYDARNTPHMYILNAQQRIVYQGAIDDRPTANAASLEGAHNYVRAALADLAANRPVAQAETRAYGCTVKYAA